MKLILTGTNRAASRTLQVAEIVHSIYQVHNEKDVEIMDLSTVPLVFNAHQSYSGPHASTLKAAIDKVNHADGLIIICPEYNGSFPGALKFFIDHWPFPEAFEFRPVCFVGLGGRYGGLRPVEHLQQVFGYRNAFLFPLRVFLPNIWEQLKERKLNDNLHKLLEEQALGFTKFVAALQNSQLDANSLRKLKSRQD